MSAPRSLRYLLVVLLLCATPVAAQRARSGDGPLDRAALADPRLRLAPATEPIETVQPLLSAEVRDGWTRFLATAGGTWQGYVDARTGRLEAAEGAGIPWIPGYGNSLTNADITAPLHDGKVDLRTLESIARAFLPRIAPLLGVDPAALVLSAGRSGQPSDALWLVDFDVQRDGRTIEGARVVFRVSHGNLIQLGSEGLPSIAAPAPRQTVERREALSALAGPVGGFGAADTFLDGGSLHLLPVTLADPRFAAGYEPGNGRGLVLVWQFLFRRKGEPGTWRGRVDSGSGEVLEFRDVNEYAKINGGVFPDSPATGGEVVLPMPFANLSPGGYADAAGNYTFPGGTVSSTLEGLYVQIFDSCGPISQSSTGSGRISFGSSPGTDCATPGTGGTGNTHSARTQFYHLNRIKQIGRGWLPANSWLSGPLNANVNLNQTCNAYWNGYSVNFFRSGGGCGNTGEIAGVSLHEYGHGLDQNDGNDSSPDSGTSESYGDITAALMTHRSCGGNGFFSSNCGGYGDACTACTGVRDIDWAQHASHAPHTVANFAQPLCGFDFGSVCGGEGHCESYIISESVWDLVARDLPNPGSAAAWSVTERLWYLSRATTGSAFTCHTGTPVWTSDGCGAGSLWRTFRAADDDDGNLANGTPHSCRLFAAFNRHGLACAADAGANVCFAACTPPPVPALTLTPGNGQVALSWTSAGAGVVYDVYKSELGCGSGFLKIANDATGTSFLDTTAPNGLASSYQVIAQPAGNEPCAAIPSVCQTATPQAPACTPPAAPGGVTAAALGIDRIRVSWSAAAGATDYLVLRATVSGGPYTQIADVAAPVTTWTDTGLSETTRYYYVVKAAADDCLSGASAEATAVTPSCSPTTLYTNSFESGDGLSDWTVASSTVAGTQSWRGIQACTAHSGGHVFRFGGAACTDEYLDDENSYAIPHGATGIQVPAGVGRTRLSFWHHWDFEPCCDGAWLTLAMDGGDFVTLPASVIIGGTTYTSGFSFTGQQTDFVNTLVDLDAACNLATGGNGGCAGHTLSIGFNVFSDVSVTGAGWFLDDVTVTACSAHGCTGAPVIGAATVPATNQIRVSWSNGTPPSSAFNVYRAFGTCAAPGAFEKVGSALAGSPFLDTNVSGGSTYAYTVTGLDVSGLCESDASACTQATATGACTLPPTFAGLDTAADPVQSTCTLDLAWAAASARCGGPVTYSIYRSSAADFVPGPANRVASGLTGTTYGDLGPLTSGATYFYIVRAVDGATGTEDTNTARRSAIPTGPLVGLGTLTETFEGAKSGGGFDNAGWTHTALTGAQDWLWSTALQQSPPHSWFAPQRGATADQVLVSPLFVPRTGTSVSFWHTYSFESCFDGGTLEISTDQGATWAVLPDSAFTAGGFTDTLYSGTTNPLAGKRGWCGGSIGAMTLVRVNLSAWAGSEVKLRWHAGEDEIVGYTGWYIDSVTIANAGLGGFCTSAPPVPLDFYTVAPCRLVDTRLPGGPLGGPALQPGALRTFALTGLCGIPATAKALQVNVTAVQPAAAGYLTLFPGGQLTPQTSSINFAPGVTRANNAVLVLGDGSGQIQVKAVTLGTVDFLLDVSGYFQ